MKKYLPPQILLLPPQKYPAGYVPGRGHKARGQGQPFRGQTLSRPRTGMLEARAKDTSASALKKKKKKVFTKIFQAISTKKNVFQKIF